MKKILILFAIMAIPFLGMADDINIVDNGIYYAIDFADPQSGARVIESTDGDGYVGDIVIPETIKWMAIEIPVTSIENYAFYGCAELLSVVIPNSVRTIGLDVFFNCSSLVSIVLPDSLICLEQGFLRNCTSLTSVTIPGSVTMIRDNAFDHCIGLTSVCLPNSLVSIGPCAFTSCYGLTSLEIPQLVSSIGYDAFAVCNALEYITCRATTPPVLGEHVFMYIPRSIPLYVPAASVPLYQAADQWGEFDIQPILVEIDPVAPQTTELTWNPVDSASLYQLHLYTDSTSSVALDTMLLINADSLNGGIMLQNGTSVARRVKKIVQDAGGTIIVITIDPTSGTSEENPYKVTVSTVSDEQIDVHFDMTVYQGTEILREESGSFVLNEDQPDGIENLLAPSLPSGIYDLYGHRYPAEAWETLPAGVYVLRTEDRVEKVMK